MLFQETDEKFQREGNQLDLVRIKESENWMLKKTIRDCRIRPGEH